MAARVRFIAEHGFCAEFLNHLIENNIQLYSIHKTQFGITAVCYADDYRYIARTARRYQTRTKIISKKGLYFVIKNMVKRKSVVLGIIIMPLWFMLFNNMIWVVNIHSDDRNMKNTVALQLLENNIYAGSFFSKDELYKVQQEIQKKNENISFVTLNFYRGVLDCNVYSRTYSENNNLEIHNNDITAAMDGIVTDMKIYSGFPAVVKGQSVAKGDILIKTTEIDRYNNISIAKPQAYVEGICDKIYTVYIPFEKETEIYTGEKQIYRRIYYPGGIYDNEKDIYHKLRTVQTKLEYGNIFGFHIPFTTETVTCYLKEKVYIKQDALQAQSAAVTQLKHLVLADIKLKKEISRSYDYRMYEDGIYALCRVKGYYDMT